MKHSSTITPNDQVSNLITWPGLQLLRSFTIQYYYKAVRHVDIENAGLTPGFNSCFADADSANTGWERNIFLPKPIQR